jgi:molybdopterin molybdotransferase
MQTATVQEALQAIAGMVPRMDTELVPLSDACKRVLRQEVFADRDFPPFPRVTMDGIAVRRQESVQSWRVAGVQAAGVPPLTLHTADTCIAVMTGACLPEGADTVIPVEDLEHTGDMYHFKGSRTLECGQFVHQQGRDLSAGSPVLEPPLLLDARSLAVCATVGVTHLEVSRRPRVAVLSTGQELVAPDQKPPPWGIRQSNDQCIRAELCKWRIPIFACQHLSDDLDAFTDALRQWQRPMDLIITCGSISKGATDFIPEALRQCGFRSLFRGVHQQPGGPGLLAMDEEGGLLLGIPGNPLSTLVFTRIYLRALLSALCGYPQTVIPLPFQEEIPRRGNKSKWLPVRLTQNQDGGTVMVPCFPGNSGDMITVLSSDGLTLIPASDEPPSGPHYPFYPWSG